MSEASFSGLCEHLAGNPWLLGLIIVLGVCFLEDPGRCVVGLLVATGDLNWWFAFSTMIIGSLVGDVGLYLIGRYAIVLCVNRRWINIERVVQMQGYFSLHAIKTLVAARFLPGARTFAFITAGVTHYGIIKFMVVLTGAAVAQALIFLYATQMIGERFLVYLENKNMRWVAVGVIVAMIFAMHFSIKALKKDTKKI